MPNQFLSPEGDLENYFVSESWLIDQWVGDTLWIWGGNSYLFYGDPLMDTILGNSTKSLSEIVGFNLLPTYSYTRLYGRGDELKSGIYKHFYIM